MYVRNKIHTCLYTILAINFKIKFQSMVFYPVKLDQCLNDGALIGRARFAFSRNENIRSLQYTRTKTRINKHIFVFTYQLYIFILVVYDDVHQFSNNRAFVAK
jgi:hypothetical protein